MKMIFLLINFLDRDFPHVHPVFLERKEALVTGKFREKKISNVSPTYFESP